MGWDRMAIMMISQCDKTKNLALNQQTLWESISLFQFHKITFLDLSLTDADSYMLTIEQLSVALRKQCNCHPITPQPPFLNQKPVIVQYSYGLHARLAPVFLQLF